MAGIIRALPLFVGRPARCLRTVPHQETGSEAAGFRALGSFPKVEKSISKRLKSEMLLVTPYLLRGEDEMSGVDGACAGTRFEFGILTNSLESCSGNLRAIGVYQIIVVAAFCVAAWSVLKFVRFWENTRGSGSERPKYRATATMPLHGKLFVFDRKKMFDRLDEPWDQRSQNGFNNRKLVSSSASTDLAAAKPRFALRVPWSSRKKLLYALSLNPPARRTNRRLTWAHRGERPCRRLRSGTGTQWLAKRLQAKMLALVPFGNANYETSFCACFGIGFLWVLAGCARRADANRRR